LAQGFVSLALSRVLVGVGEATAFPVAISMLAVLYSAPRRPRAIAIFQSNVFVGVVLGSILAGVLAATYRWPAMFLICGAAGLVLVAVIAPTLREPERERAGARPTWSGRGARRQSTPAPGWPA
jgi:MFS family permease